MTDGWREVFGHDEPYAEQAEGIETVVETARDDGFTVVEGACGTGKTMMALTAGIHLVRDPESSYERVVVLTSVKQQLRQFEEDLRTINDDLPDGWNPVTGLTLVGKADVCPYRRENAGGIDGSNVYDRCETLREKTRLLTRDGPTTAENLAAEARSQQIGLADSGRDGGAGATYLESAGEPSPYPTAMPEFDGDGGGGTEYCPFYARYLADLPEEGDPGEAVPFDFSSLGHVGPENLVGLSMEHGTCPHSMMGALLGHAEVVVGNYYHAFDPVTVASFTGALLDESTFVVCDEAHMLEPRVRDLVSDAVADASLRDAITELTRVIQAVSFDSDRTADAGQDTDLARAELEDTNVSVEDLRATRGFYRDLREEVDRRVTAHLDRERRGWRADLADLDDEEIPLREPETPQPDAISEWAAREGYDESAWLRGGQVGAVVARVLNAMEDEEHAEQSSAEGSSGRSPRENQRAAPGVGRTLGNWYENDHEQYFREIILERTWDDTEPPDSWRRAYNARLAMQNCVPSDAIGGQIAEFGGGVLMSATLEPLDVFAEVTGLDHLREAEDRPVVERTFGLHFPEENRESFAVAAPKFTYDNRGDPGEETPVRRAYADTIAEVARSPGNVLVGMPNYSEATWAADALDALVEKPVLIDESSDDADTEQLKTEFFAGEPKVLVTSLRGTLTEGVDYQGEKLRAAAVCGVPIVNTASPRTRAVRTAYDREFGDGFTYALTIPAVRKARQALGRVIRGPEEVGVRVLVDERYARDSWDSVHEFFPAEEREEFQPVSPDMLNLGLDRFWSGR